MGRKGFFTDTSICIGCKACEVACKEWNEVPASPQGFTGRSYDNTIDLGADTWRHVAFIEQRKPLDLGDDGASLVEIREFPAFNITGGQRGIGRMGGDTWPVLKNKRGERGGFAYTRYPENNWRNLDLHDWFLAPGPDGPVATSRLEALKEGPRSSVAALREPAVRL